MESVSEMINTSITIVGDVHSDSDTILTNNALTFFEKIHRQFQSKRTDLLIERKVKQEVSRSELENAPEYKQKEVLDNPDKYIIIEN